MKSFLLTMLLGVLVACTTAPVTTQLPQNAIIVQDELGGRSVDYAARADTYRRSGRPVVILGFCHSACSILASLPNACLMPSSVIGLHWPRNIFGNTSDPVYFNSVTPQIRAKVLSLPFDPSNPSRIYYEINYWNAERYGLRRCNFNVT
jgi:hypothetical protein